jgi:hypothetical protein
MIVQNNGYLKQNQVLELLNSGASFAIYKTHKNTNILVKGVNCDNIDLYYAKKDRLPWKTVEGKKVISGTKIFDSNSRIEDLDTSGWNNKNQIICYEEYYYDYRS